MNPRRTVRRSPDAIGLLSKSSKDAYDKGDLADMTFADETVLLGVSALHVEDFLRAVSVAAQRYGLSLHYGKLHLLGVRSSTAIRAPIGGKVEAGQDDGYLGTVLAGDGRSTTELARRIGMPKRDFHPGPFRGVVTFLTQPSAKAANLR